MFRKLSAALSVGMVAAAAPLEAQAGIGVVGGFVSANYTLDPATAGTTYSSRGGFAAGLSLKTAVASGITFGPELLYAQKGANVAIVSGTANYSGWAKVGYIEVPLLLSVGAGSGSTKFFATAGPQFSYRLSCTASLPVLSGGVVSNREGACDDVIASPGGLKSSDYGIMFGAGVSMDQLSLSARYDLGLANVSKDPTASASTVKNKAIFVLLGWSFGK